MRILTFIAILFIGPLCKAQTKQEGDDVKFHTINIKGIDSGYKKEVRYVYFEHSAGVIFPVDYAQKAFGSSNKYFMPDSGLIKRIVPQIITQSCNAIFKLNEANLKDLIHRSSDKKEKERYRKAITTEKQHIDKWCQKWRDSLSFYDIQFIGYIIDDERVVQINIVDLRKDHQVLKKWLGVSWISNAFDETSGPVVFTGWYYVKRDLLTVNTIK